MKDFAATWDQKSWEYAVKTHRQSLQRLAALESQDANRVLIRDLIDYYKNQVKSLEAKYPQLNLAAIAKANGEQV